MARRGSWIRKLIHTIAWALAGWLLLTSTAVLLLRWFDPPSSAFMIAARVEAVVGRDHTFVFRHRWVDLAHISPNLALAVVASEDQKFPEHWGFDVQAIEKAYELNQRNHKIHGASTISQQVAKNLFLWSGRSYFRKGLEAYFTVLIEVSLPKRRILEIYLNIAEFADGVYGADAAAQFLFHKPASRLTRSDAALLAAVLPNPERYAAASPTRYVLQRRDWILRQMQALGGAEMLEEIDAYPDRLFGK
jgi:monofunctional biosynthetic peptidoglycan transglycosylase